MKNKFFIKILSCIMAVFGLGNVAACGGSGGGNNDNPPDNPPPEEDPVIEIPENLDYEQTFSLDDLSAGADGVTVYGSKKDDVWIAQGSEGSGGGYPDRYIAYSEEFLLEAGHFRFAFSAAINDTSSRVPDNYPENDMVMLYRVVNAVSGEEFASGEIYRKSFTSINKMHEFSVNFANAKTTMARVEVRSQASGTTAVSYSGAEIKGIRKSENTERNHEDYFAESDADKALSYEADKLYFFDLYAWMEKEEDSAFCYDVAAAVFALQGLVNRDGQHLFVRFNAPNAKQTNQDRFWLDYLQKPGNFLAGKTLVTVERPATLLRLFSSAYNGFAVWDEKVPATSNVAFTASGADNLLPVRYKKTEQSLYGILKRSYNLRVKLDLSGKFTAKGKIWDTDVDSTGSAKNDAYLWAVEKYLASGKTNAQLLAYHLDAFSWDKSGVSAAYYNLQQLMLANKDYYVMNKAFFFDLGVFDTYLPNDDIGQKKGTDYNTLLKILKVTNERAAGELFTMGGFVPWWIKYGKTATPDAPIASDVSCEWQLTQLLGTYYGVKDADAYGYTGLANASVYSKVPQPEKYTQKADISDAAIAARAAKYINPDGTVKTNNYVYIYMGDYDCGAWITMAMQGNFSDGGRDSLPLAWPINPTGFSRVPMVANYIYERQTENDYFIGDHNGYGYTELMNVGLDPSLNGSLEHFGQKTKEVWEKYDLDIMGFLINTTGMNYNMKVKRFMSDLSPRGVVTNGSTTTVPVVNSSGKTVYWSWHQDMLPGASVTTQAEHLSKMFAVPASPQFKMLRPILYSPSYIFDVFSRRPSDRKIEVVDPYVYFYLLEICEGNI